MGKHNAQKLSERPSVDLWLRHVREQDKRGVPVPTRTFPETDRKQLSEVQTLERLRGRYSLSVHQEPLDKPGISQCQQCGQPLPDRGNPEAAGWKLKRVIYSHPKVRLYVCGECGGRSG